MKTLSEAHSKRGRGRPAMPEGEARTILTGFKVSAKEAKAIAKASRAENIDKSEWMRRSILRVLGLA